MHPLRTQHTLLPVILMTGLVTPAMAHTATDTIELKNQLLLQKQQLEVQQQQLNALLAQVEQSPAQASRQTEHSSETASGLSWSGYGVINYRRFDFYTNTQDAIPERIAETDLERFILAPTFRFNERFALVAELEIEHGGTGSTVEYEAEEAGEFEIEVEKGGEVVLEQAHLLINLNTAFNWRIGEIVVPVGMVNSHHEPTQYFTQQRSLAETSLIPSVWHETGVEMFGQWGPLRYQIQVVPALDSAGFSGYGFAANASRSVLETNRADSLAWVARVDYTPLAGLLVGGSFYTGDTAGNRARANLDLPARLNLGEAHLRFERGPWTVRAEYLAGELDNSDAVTHANYTTYNAEELGISKTPIGSLATAYFVEAGIDVLTWLKPDWGRLDLFARVDDWNTHDKTVGNIVAVERYDRRATTWGLNYHPRSGVVFKGEFSHRTHAGSLGSEQDYLGVGLGFEF